MLGQGLCQLLSYLVAIAMKYLHTGPKWGSSDTKRFHVFGVKITQDHLGEGRIRMAKREHRTPFANETVLAQPDLAWASKHV